MNRSLKALALGLTLAAVPAFAKNDALSLVPTNAVTVGVVKLREMRTSPLSSVLFQHADSISADGDAARFLNDAGLEPSKDVDVLMVATYPRTNLGTEADVLIAADGRFNVDRLTKALAARGAVKKNNYYVLPDDAEKAHGETGAVAFPDSTLVVAGTERAVIAALAARANGGTGFFTANPLGHDTARIDPNATAWAIIDVTRAQRLAHAPHVSGSGGGKEALSAAMKNLSTVAIWATDTGDSLKLGALGFSNDAETLDLLEDTVRGALAALRLAVKDQSPDLVPVLRKFDVSRSDNTIAINGTLPASTIRDLMAKKHAEK